jgi:hypothetical protein
VERITDSINKFVFTTLEPYLKPIMSTGALRVDQIAAASR